MTLAQFFISRWPLPLANVLKVFIKSFTVICATQTVKTLKSILNTNLSQYIEEIVKSITKCDPLNRPGELRSIEERTPEVWLEQIRITSKNYTIYVMRKKSYGCLCHLAKRNWDEKPIWFQNPVNTFEHRHDFGHCFRLGIPWIATVHKQYLLHNQKVKCTNIFTWLKMKTKHTIMIAYIIFN